MSRQHSQCFCTGLHQQWQLVTALASLLLSIATQAAPEPAHYEAAVLQLPLVEVGGAYYKAELERENSDPSVFRVTKAEQLTFTTQPEAVARFANNVLSISEVLAPTGSQQWELQLVNANPMLFKLSNVAKIGSQAPLAQALMVTDSAGLTQLSNARGGVNYEPVVVTVPNFDKQRSLTVFKDTLYPYLRSNTCVACHNAGLPSATAGQAPLHADNNVELAHEYALTRVNFADPINSKLVVRMGIDRHNCPGSDCAKAAQDMLAAVQAWKAGIADMLPAAPRLLTAEAKIGEADVTALINADKAKLAAADKPYIVYTSMHELHNEGLSADELNVVRAGLSKALNSVARWAPKIVNPVDVTGHGILYKFDIRDYWGWNKGVTRLLFGGSDDDLAFGRNKRDYRGNLVTGAVQRERYNYTETVSWDPTFALKVWERVLHGNVEGAVMTGTIKPYINGFRGKRSSNAAGEYVELADFEWVETAQLIYTLTRPDVYNAIMLLPMYADQLEDELGVDRSRGMDSYDYVLSFDAITIDSRLLWRARRKDGGWYWKTWDIFTGQLSGNRDRNIFDVYKESGSDIRFPWWANPIPVFVSPAVDRKDTTTWSFVASLAQPFTTNPSQIPAGCDPQPNFSGIQGFYNCRHFTGTGGGQQSASEIIWNLPNGLQGYMLTGAFNQRRVDAFTNIVRDPRVVPTAKDNIATQTGFTFGKTNGIGGFGDPRLNVGSSCIACHVDGMNRLNNDLRDWLDENPAKLPKGQYGVDGWINDAATVARVKELYPPSTVVREYTEAARKTFLGSMAEIKSVMMLGPDKNLHVEPVIWTVEYVQRKKYQYPQTTSN